ncbi:Protein of unknown function DUF761, plant [Dillenia turbinata]|uniref:Uncharacterized protein n=1 Tax=Dillenia turbinata TaxID=194707 RepID=A0AAN8W8B0_9MAGN
MEAQQNGAIIPVKDNAIFPAVKPPRDVTKAKKKRGGALQMIRAALFMLRKRSKGKKTESLPLEVASTGILKDLVGSMRPLHLQTPNTPPPALNESGKAIVTAELEFGNAIVVEEQYEDVFAPPFSPSAASSSSSSGTMSRYASAQSLQDLDREETVELDDEGGDLKIDAKAEEFIAQFYESMRLQRLDSFNRYKEMLASFLGAKEKGKRLR